VVGVDRVLERREEGAGEAPERSTRTSLWSIRTTLPDTGHPRDAGETNVSREHYRDELGL